MIRHIEELDPAADHKPLITATHELLTGRYEKDLVSGAERDGNLVYHLHEITHANNGAVVPDLD